MGKCGNEFQLEIGKFRFLNEMIKLVSPKYAAENVRRDVRDRTLDLLLTWSFQYKKITKIKEAYDILIKQGIEHTAPKNHRISKSADVLPAVQPNSRDEVFKEIPKELLYSKDPKDIQAANLLIEKMIETVS